jgi:hypothetical protein
MIVFDVNGSGKLLEVEGNVLVLVMSISWVGGESVSSSGSVAPWNDPLRVAAAMMVVVD